MSKEKTAESWLRVSELREQKSQMEVAKAQAQVVAAGSYYDSSLARLAKSQSIIRAQTANVVSAASIELLSRGLAADEAAVARAREGVEAAKQKLGQVVALHSEISKQRMVAEKYKARLRRERIDEWERKQDREASDRAGRTADS